MGVAFCHLRGIFQFNAAINDSIIWHMFFKWALYVLMMLERMLEAGAVKWIGTDLVLQLWFISKAIWCLPAKLCWVDKELRGSYFWKLKSELAGNRCMHCSWKSRNQSFGRLNYCDKLHDVQSLQRFPSCTSSWIEDCKSLAKSLNLSNFHNLQKLFLSNCHEPWEIPGLEERTSLEHIDVSGCSSIEILPNLSLCTNLVSLIVQNCKKLTELWGLGKLQQLVGIGHF